MIIRLIVAITLIASTVHASTPRAVRSGSDAFIQNVGQFRYTDGSPVTTVDAVARFGNTVAWVHRSGMHVVQQKVHRVEGQRSPEVDYFRVDMELVGSNPMARLETLSADGTTRIYGPGDSALGRVASRWRVMTYRDVYDGIDLRITMNETGPKVDFIVHPGADPSVIAVRYQGADHILKDEDGSVWASTPLGSLRESAPVSWTEHAPHGRIAVQSSYLVDGNAYRFQLEAYDHSKVLVIDPQRVWATYYGGNGGFGEPQTTVDQDGMVYLAGTTVATDLPRSTGVFQPRLRARSDGYIVKWSETGAFIWQTFVGGTGNDQIYDITTDARGHIWVCGMLDSNNHPLVGLDLNGSGPYGTLEGDTIIGEAGFVMRLTKDGLWGDSWIMDGREQDGVASIDVNNDRIAIVGYTRSPRVMEITGNPYAKNPANNTRQYDMFVSRCVQRPGNQYRFQNDWLTYYGGSLDDFGVKVAIDAAGNVTAAGYTLANDVPTTDGSTSQGVSDVMMLRIVTPTAFNPQRAWASVVGGSDYENPTDLRLDATGNPIIVGLTSSNNFPVANAYQAAINGSGDGFIRKFNAANGAAIFSTYWGGNQSDQISSLSLDKAGRLWIAGSTSASTNLPVTNDAFQKTVFNDAEYTLTDGFMALLSADGRTVNYCSYYGAPPQASLPPRPNPPDPPPPPSTDYGTDMITDVFADGNAYIVFASSVMSVRMPTTPGAYQDSSSTKIKKDTILANAFLSYFTNCKDSIINVVINGSPNLCVVETRQLIAPAGFAKYKWSTGDTVRQITVSDTGNYVVTCTTVDGCRYRDTVRIQRNPSPNVTAGRDTVMCVNGAVRLTANVSGGTAPYKYKWRRQEAGPTYIDDDTLRSPTVNPNTTSNYIVTVTDVNGCTGVDTVRVSVTDPRPTASPTLVDFGTLDACQSSKTATMRVKNPMPYPISITGSTPDGSGIAVQTDLTSGVLVNAGDSALITLIATPTNTGVTNGSIIVSGDPCGWKLTVNYRITKSNSAATITPSVLDFGSAVNCTPVTRDSFAVIRNSGTDPLTVQPGAIDAPFSIVAPTVATTIAPGDTLRVTIRYNPTADGTFSSVATFPYTAGACADTFRVTTRGTRSSVSVEATPTTIDFGTLEGCEDERDSVITITNTGTVAATISLPTRTDVVFNPAGPIDLAAGASQQVTVTIRPAASGNFSATVDLTVQPCDQKITLTLSAVKQGVAFTTPSTIGLGELNTCTDPATRTQSYSISFDGTGTSTASTVTTGPSITTTLTSGTTFDAGTPKSFDVVWTPTADGALVDSIVIVFEPCSVRRMIRVTGVRTTPSLRAVTPNVALGALAGDATGTIRFENNGTDTLFVGALASQYAIVVNATPSPIEPLLPGAFLTVDYRIVCTPTINDTITAATIGGCQLTARTVFTGTCDKSVNASATVVIDDVSAAIGEKILVPMRLTASSGLNAVGLTNWRAKITYNPMVVVGTGATPDCYVDGQYTPCTIEIIGVRSDTVGLLTNLELIPVLGTDVRTDLVITEFKWIEDTTVITSTKNGSVTLSDICDEGGVRLLDPKASAFSIKVYPIPASTQLTIDVKGLGSQAGTWTMFNYIGAQVANGPLTPDAQGNALVTVDVSSFGSGTYFLTIDARGQIYRMPVLIQR